MILVTEELIEAVNEVLWTGRIYKGLGSDVDGNCERSHGMYFDDLLDAGMVFTDGDVTDRGLRYLENYGYEV